MGKFLIRPDDRLKRSLQQCAQPPPSGIIRIQNPLRSVATQIKQSPAVGWQQADRVRLSGEVLKARGLFRIQPRFRVPATGILPLRFRREAVDLRRQQAQLFGVLSGCELRHADSRMPELFCGICHGGFGGFMNGRWCSDSVRLMIGHQSADSAFTEFHEGPPQRLVSVVFFPCHFAARNSERLDRNL